MLREWQAQALRYFGRHEKTYPAANAVGYRYAANVRGNGWSYPVLIYAKVPESGLTWENSPQVKLWLGGRR